MLKVQNEPCLTPFDQQEAMSRNFFEILQDGNKSASRQEVKELAVWCSHNNLELNTLKTVEMRVDFRRNPPALSPVSTHRLGQHCDCRVIQVPGHHHLPGPEVGPS